MTVLEREGQEAPSEGAVGTATVVAVAPVVLTLPMPERILIIEVLSPGNKRPGSDGRREYLSKREAILQSATHLVEMDLLRQGERLPTIEPLPPADYYAFICRGQRRPRAEVYPWTLRHPLPPIPVPLAGEDPDVILDLRFIFNTVYDRAGYDYSLDYRRSIESPPSEADAAWAQQVLAAASSPSQ